MKRGLLATTVVSGGIYSLLMPISGLVLLSVAEYGIFSALYLGFALGVSLQYSIVSDATSRLFMLTSVRDKWESYASALIVISMVISIGVFAFAYLFPDESSAIIFFSLASGVGVIRSGTRYFLVTEIRLIRTFLADVLGIFVFLLIIFLTASNSGLESLSIAWLLSGCLTILCLKLPKFRVRLAREWYGSHRTQIRPLLADSLMLDFSAIAVPYLVLAQVGVFNFAIYRGIASAAVPVRLILDPLRPFLSRQSRQTVLKFSAGIFWVSVGSAVAAGVYFGVGWIGEFPQFSRTVLFQLVNFRSEIAIYVLTSFLANILYFVSRTNIQSRPLVMARIVQTLLVSIFPLLGALYGGLDGAILSFVISNVLSATIWWFVLSRGQSSVGPTLITHSPEINQQGGD